MIIIITHEEKGLLYQNKIPLETTSLLKTRNHNQQEKNNKFDLLLLWLLKEKTTNVLVICNQLKSYFSSHLLCHLDFKLHNTNKLIIYR